MYDINDKIENYYIQQEINKKYMLQSERDELERLEIEKLYDEYCSQFDEDVKHRITECKREYDPSSWQIYLQLREDLFKQYKLSNGTDVTDIIEKMKTAKLLSELEC